MAKILLTGGCGFIGSNLTPILRDAGHSLTIIDNLSRGAKSNLSSPEGVDIHEVDILDEDRLGEIARGHDAVIHLAALGSVVESVADPVENFYSNAEGTFRVLNGARKAGIKKVVFSSTGGAIMGNTPPPVNEESLPKPISPYGASKLAGEAYCAAFAGAYDMSITATRFANVIGPISAHKKGAVTVFIRALMNDEPITIYGDGEASRDFLYVGDLCKGILAAFETDLPGFNVFHLASGVEVSVYRLAKTLCKIAEKPNHEILYLEKRRGEVERNFANYEKARLVLGFEPEWSLEQGLRQTWEWFLETEGRKRR